MVGVATYHKALSLGSYVAYPHLCVIALYFTLKDTSPSWVVLIYCVYTIYINQTPRGELTHTAVPCNHTVVLYVHVDVCVCVCGGGGPLVENWIL